MPHRSPGYLRARASLPIAMYIAAVAILKPCLAEERFNFRQLDTQAGLSGDSVYCMHQDSQGYLWLGTFSGLSRYDGSRVVVYKPVPGDPESLPSSLIFDIHEDLAGTLWIATDGGGLARYSRDSDSFRRYSHDPGSPLSPGSDRMFAVADDPYGWIWVGTADAGIDRLDIAGGAFRHYRTGDGLPSDTVRSLLCDSEGVLWAGTTAGLARYDRARDTFEPVPGAGSVTVRAIMEDEDGSLLIGTEGRGVRRLARGAVSSRQVDLGQDSGTLLVRAFARDLHGRVWVGTEDRGVRMLDADGKRVRSLRAAPDSPDSLGHDAVRSLLVDRSGLVWVGTRGGGASTYNPRSRVITRMASEEGLPPFEARQILESSAGLLWIGTDGGGLVKADGDGRPIRIFGHIAGDAASLPGDRVICLAEEPGGAIWVGTDGTGLARLDPASGRFVRFARDPRDPGSLGGDTVWAILFDSSGTLWVGLEGGGLDRYDRASGSFVHHRPTQGDPYSISGNSVRAMLEDSKGRLWLGLWDGGLTLWDRQTSKALARLKPESDPGSLADSSVTCLLEDSSGRLWVGTGGSGIDRVIDDPYTLRFEHLGMADGLAGDDIVGALEDTLGDVWIVTGRGVSRWDAKDGRILSWGPADGFQARFGQNSYAMLSDGRIALGGSEGLDLFWPEHLEHPDTPPPVVIADVSIVAHPEADSAATSRRRRSFRAALKKGVIVLRPEDAALTLDFAVLDFVDPPRNRLSASLWGGPAEQMELGSQNRAILGGLAPGEYELRLSGATAGGIWNREAAVLSIVVKPPLWRTPPFAASLAVVIVASAYAVFRSRTKALERRAEQLRTLSMHIQDAREEERKTAAREVHDELGQLLTAAKMDLSWLRSHPPAPDAFGSRVGEAISMVDSAIDSVKSISTRLRPRALDTLSLSEALRWQLEDFRRRSSMECRATIDPAPDDIDEGSATTMFRVFQEILTNIGRHSDARTVDVRFAVSDGTMMLEVLDDGKGLPKSAVGSPASIGILGMRERARHDGGSFEIESPVEELGRRGTRVRVNVPVRLPGKRRRGSKGDGHA